MQLDLFDVPGKQLWWPCQTIEIQSPDHCATPIVLTKFSRTGTGTSLADRLQSWRENELKVPHLHVLCVCDLGLIVKE